MRAIVFSSSFPVLVDSVFHHLRAKFHESMFVVVPCGSSRIVKDIRVEHSESPAQLREMQAFAEAFEAGWQEGRKADRELGHQALLG